jgi:phage tail sheath protein FI
LLDAAADADVATVLRQRAGLSGTNAALYYPWLVVRDGSGIARAVPPCGHVAGVYADTDQQVGVFKAPANVALEGVLDLARAVSADDQGELNPQGINAMRVFPGRGIRVWGARTVSQDRNWRYVNVRRLFMTAGRWIERNLTPLAFEPHDTRLWARIGRELTAYFNGLYQQGALKGASAAEAFVIKCDAENNPPEGRAAGMVVTDVAFAAAVPNEFVVVRISVAPSGVTLAALG